MNTKKALWWYAPGMFIVILGTFLSMVIYNIPFKNGRLDFRTPTIAGIPPEDWTVIHLVSSGLDRRLKDWSFVVLALYWLVGWRVARDFCQLEGSWRAQTQSSRWFWNDVSAPIAAAVIYIAMMAISKGTFFVIFKHPSMPGLHYGMQIIQGTCELIGFSMAAYIWVRAISLYPRLGSSTSQRDNDVIKSFCTYLSALIVMSATCCIVYENSGVRYLACTGGQVIW
jgi:hypothetical protein